MAAYNFPNSPSDGDTVTSNGITYTYSSSKTRWDGAAASGSSTTVYETIDDLPLSGASTGDQAYVEGNNRLYIWNGTGWYNIALINTNPSISGANASYTLATDGTATTVTITATDPEGIPITYSIASDTSGNVATVTQGTGSNTNVFTITPSTNTANEGTFSLTFRASDGVNIATAVSEFTLLFAVANSNYTTALITSVGANNAVNNSFDDASTNNHTITANGNVTQNTFSPYRHGGYSTYLGSATSYVRTPTDARYDIGGTGDWSYEAWIYVPTSHTLQAYARGFGLGPHYNNAKSFGVLISDDDFSDKMTVYWNDGSIGRKLTSTTAFQKGQWNHIAVCRTGNDIALYYNGTRIAHNSSYTASISTGNTYLFLGHSAGGGIEGFIGYIRDAHFVNGSHDYDASSASLTVPTGKISAITNTEFLGAQEPYVNDNSTNNVAITTNGTITTEPFSPYDYSGYSASNNGGSMYFAGGSDYLTASPAAPSTGDFCYECWINVSQASDDAVLETRTANNSPYGFTLTVLDSSTIRVYSNNAKITASGLSYLNQWTHLCVEKVGSTTTLYINGTSAGTTADLSNMSDTTFRIGESGQYGAFSGHIADFRYVRGGYVYNGNFTPPTEPLTAISGTELLINGTNAGIIDKSQSVKTITLNGDAKSSTTQSKFLTSSMYFDGTGDYVEASSSDAFDFGSLDWTLECWAYLQTDSDNTGGIIEIYKDDNNYIRLFRDSGPDVQLRGASGGTTQFDIQSSAQSQDTWIHVAAVRNGSTVALYLDGTRIDTDTSFTIPSLSGAQLLIGADLVATDRYFTGYISDVRITKGLARYTAADETANIPSAALQG